jgi:hypothetical protein
MVAREFFYNTAPELTGVIGEDYTCVVVNCIYAYKFILNNTSGRLLGENGMY